MFHSASVQVHGARNIKTVQAAVWGGKMTPSAVLVIKDGSVRMVPVNNNDPVSKIIDMAPDVIHRFMNKSEDDAAVESAVEHISEEE